MSLAWRAAALGLALSNALACGGAGRATVESPPATSAPEAVRYRIRPDATLATMAVEVCFRGAAPRALVARSPQEASFLLGARVRGAGRLAVGGGRIELAGVGRDACVSYGVDLAAAARTSRFGGSFAQAVVVTVQTWLWAPWPRSARLDARVSAELPDGMAASLPWPAHDAEHVLDERAFRFQACSVFGHFTTAEVDAPDAKLEVAIVDPERAPATDALVHWLSEAARVASLLYGRFPTDWAQIVVVPVRASTDPVAFGIAGRGSPGSIVFFVASNAQEQALVSDWVAVHEMTHLGAPFVQREDSWLTEGLATYYQEILRGRAGLQSPERTFWALDDGFRRGAASGSGRSIADEAGGHAFERVYWGGAAIVLEADVALRRQSGGTRSLDDALAELRACCSEDARPWTAAEMVARIDRASGTSALGDAVARDLRSSDFPPARELLARLGVTTDAHEAHLDDAAPDAAIRRALLQPTTP